MSESITPAEVDALRAEIAALKRENEVLYKWLDDQKRHASDLRHILLNRGDSK